MYWGLTSLSYFFLTNFHPPVYRHHVIMWQTKLAGIVIHRQSQCTLHHLNLWMKPPHWLGKQVKILCLVIFCLKTLIMHIDIQQLMRECLRNSNVVNIYIEDYLWHPVIDIHLDKPCTLYYEKPMHRNIC